MRHENYNCDICQRVFSTPNDLPGCISIDDGVINLDFYQVCER